jgi:hypothetical protein
MEEFKAETPQTVPRIIDIETARAQMAAVGLRPRGILTVIGWIEKYKLGYKVGGNWVLWEHKWHAFLRGDYYFQEQTDGKD